MVGAVIRKAVDAFAESDLTEEEKRIAHEIDKLRVERIDSNARRSIRRAMQFESIPKWSLHISGDK
jgi:hypothetical protein